MIFGVMIICSIVIGISLLLLVLRLLKGPTTIDRVIALDAIGVSLIGLIGIFSIIVDTAFYVEIILLLAVLSFIGTISFAKFLEKGKIIDDSSKK
nr:Na(+)/H(+) antiporter subunit F1 [Kurthia senegalensis]